MSNDFMDFGFGSGDENMGNSRYERLRIKGGESVRLSFIWLPLIDGKPDFSEEAKTRFSGAKRFFIKDVGYVLDNHPELAKYAEQPSKATFATVVASWPLTRQGALDKQRLADVTVQPWIFGEDKYSTLRRIDSNFPLSSFDVIATCDPKGENFQKLTFTSCRESIYKTVCLEPKLAHIAQDIQTKLKGILRPDENGVPVGIHDIIARKVSIEKVREKKGGAPAIPGGISSGSANDSRVNEVLDGLLDD
jgi:hypothetical protein